LAFECQPTFVALKQLSDTPQKVESQNPLKKLALFMYFSSIELENSFYFYEESNSTVCCAYIGSDETFFPRNFICSSGFCFRVDSFHSPIHVVSELLEFVCIPSSIQTIREDYFFSCSSLLNFAFESGSTVSVFGKRAFCNSPLQSIFIPSSVENLHPLSFSGCKSLSSVLFESGSKLSVIQRGAFSVCSSLQSICIPSSVQTLCENCFLSAGLSSVTFESDSQLSTLDPCVFLWCKSLLSVSLPSGIEEIGGGIPVPLKDSFESVNERFIFCCDFFFNLKTKSIIQYFGAEEEFDLVAVIDELGTDFRIVGFGPWSFASKSRLKSIRIISSVEKLCKYCFRDCENLSSVIFERDCKVSVIEEEAFSGCSSLTSICIPAGVKTLGDACFAFCFNLSPLIFESGSQVVNIGDASFAGCQSLTSICIPATVKTRHKTCVTNEVN
jgi:hypothetical protein